MFSAEANPQKRQSRFENFGGSGLEFPLRARSHMHSKVAYTLKRGRRSEKWHGNGEKRNFRFSGNSNPLPPKFSERDCRFCGFASAENTTVYCIWTCYEKFVCVCCPCNKNACKTVIDLVYSPYRMHHSPLYSHFPPK